MAIEPRHTNRKRKPKNIRLRLLKTQFDMKELLVFCVFVLPAVLILWWTNYEEAKWLKDVVSKWRRESRKAGKDAEREEAKDEDI